MPCNRCANGLADTLKQVESNEWPWVQEARHLFTLQKPAITSLLAADVNSTYVRYKLAIFRPVKANLIRFHDPRQGPILFNLLFFKLKYNISPSALLCPPFNSSFIQKLLQINMYP